MGLGGGHEPIQTKNIAPPPNEMNAFFAWAYVLLFNIIFDQFKVAGADVKSKTKNHGYVLDNTTIIPNYF